MNDKVVLITGAAKRLGRAMACYLHAKGWRVILHYGQSREAAETCCAELNAKRANSAVTFQADLNQLSAISRLALEASAHWGQIDALINNASTFYPTRLDALTEAAWDQLMNANAKAPLFLSQHLAPGLKQQRGVIINLVDMHVERPLKDFHVYLMAKAALQMLTKTLALSLAPEVRVNGVAPGIILWGEQEADFSAAQKERMIARVPLARQGTPEEIAEAVYFLLTQSYVSGQILTVDGGRSLAV